MDIDLSGFHARRVIAIRADKVLLGLLCLPAVWLMAKSSTVSLVRVEVAAAIVAATAVWIGRQAAFSLALFAPHLVSDSLLHFEWLCFLPIVLGGALICSLAATISATRQLARLPKPHGLCRLARRKPSKRRRRINRGEVLRYGVQQLALLVAAALMFAGVGLLIEHRILTKLMYFAGSALMSASALQLHKRFGAVSRGVVDDGRPAILVLRSFAADPALKEEGDRRKDPGVDRDDFRSNADHVVTPLWELGRIITVASHAEGLPGEYYDALKTSEQWQGDIAREAAQASLIVIFVDRTPSLGWEIRHVVSTKALREKALFVWAHEHAPVDSVLSMIAEAVEGPKPHPPASPANLRALRFLRDGTPLMIFGPRTTEVFATIAERYVIETLSI